MFVHDELEGGEHDLECARSQRAPPQVRSRVARALIRHHHDPRRPLLKLGLPVVESRQGCDDQIGTHLTLRLDQMGNQTQTLNGFAQSLNDNSQHREGRIHQPQFAQA